MTKRKPQPGTVMGWSILSLLTVLSVFAYFNKPTEKAVFSYTEFLGLVEKNEISRVVLTDSEKLAFVLTDGTSAETDNPRNPELKESLLLQGVTVSEGTGAGAWQGIVAFMAAIAVFSLLARSTAKGQVKTSMAAEIKAAEKSARFDDVAGNVEAKAEVADIVDFIKNPAKYAALGAHIPRGLIFYGPPGTGKTLMARAVAGEAEAPFYAVSGSDFVQMYVGVGAARVRDLFKKAVAAGKAVIFIDEIDALGKTRGAGAGGNDERDQTLNALLTEMSGFSPKDGIVVIAATNRVDTLDEALLRPGRFDRHVEVGLPDVAARKQILELHAKNKPMDESINYDALAGETAFFSGAMLENMLNEAAITAAREGESVITAAHIDAAYYKQLAGMPKAGETPEAAKRITAYHEAGHALVSKLALPDSKVAKVTILPSTKGAGGFCVSIPPDRPYMTKRETRGQMLVALAGRAAEELAFGADGITTGASNDLERVAALARDYIAKYGMGDGGLIAPEGRELVRAVGDLAEELYAEVKGLIGANAGTLEAIAAALLARETLDAGELEALAG